MLLADQDRSRWDAAAVAEGVTLLGEALRRSGDLPHRFVAQAAVAAGLREIEAVAGLDAYPFQHAARAVLLRRLGREAEAADAEARSAALPLNDATRGLLERP